MAITTSICNHKGGVGKTTTVINLAAALANIGKKVLVVDLDPQGNSTMVLFPGDPFATKTVLDLFTEQSSLFHNVYQPSTVKNLSIIPSNLRLMQVKSAVANDYKAVAGLKNKFTQQAQKEFDYIFFDCPPDLGAFVNNALVISDYYILPVAAEDKFGLRGLEDIIKMAGEIKQSLNPKLDLMGILITLYDDRTTISKAMRDVIKTQFPEKLFNTIINRNTDISQAVAKNKTIFQHDRRAQGAKDYVSLAQEVMRYVEESGRAQEHAPKLSATDQLARV